MSHLRVSIWVAGEPKCSLLIASSLRVKPTHGKPPDFIHFCTHYQDAELIGVK